MMIKSRIIDRATNAIALVVFFTLLSVWSCSAQVVSQKRINHLGFEGSFGARTFTIDSDIPELHQLQATLEGGSLGLVAGNDFFRSKLRVAGFYFASANTPRTIDLYEAEVMTNFYPLEFFRKKRQSVDVYVTSGFTLTSTRFFGHYLLEDKVNINYSDINNEPFVGSLTHVAATIGAGVEYHVPVNRRDFVHLFVEARYSSPFQKSGSRSLERTALTGTTSIGIGAAFGIHRQPESK